MVIQCIKISNKVVLIEAVSSRCCLFAWYEMNVFYILTLFSAMLWNKHMSHVPLVAPRQVYTDETSALRGLNFDQIEAEFRKRMRSNYVNLKKAFLAFDAQKDGFIGLEDLKSVLNNFTLPMTDQLFGQLMDRYVGERFITSYNVLPNLIFTGSGNARRKCHHLPAYLKLLSQF